MPPKSSQPSSSKQPPAKKQKTKATTVKFDAPPPNSQRINPLTAFANTQVATDGEKKPSQSQKSKGKEKEKEKQLRVDEDRLWVDIYEPVTEAELAVHVKKVQDVRRWLDEAFVGGPTGKLRKYRRILALTGPAGTAKTTTIRILARELNLEILEWRNSAGESRGNIDDDTLFSKFETFLERASTCQNLFEAASSSAKKRQLILVEDFPNILHSDTQVRFHAALNALVSSPTDPPVPVVVIVSDAGLRGEASDERLANGSWGKDRDQALDIRSVLPKDLLHGPYVTQIAFNPIAPTLMKKALQALISTHFGAKPAPSKEMLDIIIETSNGDIRSAIMALQFSSVVELPATSGKRKKANNGSGSARVVLEAVTRREQSLHLFHLIGKVLYNKRKGDPPNPSATAKDKQKDKELDARLKDPPKLPAFLTDHARRTSRVDVDLLYADSPIDSSLFSLYIQQNYTQFCNEVEECEGVSEWLSWVDSSGGEAWYQANPHRFHLLTLGTLHSLPTPVPRRSQKLFKPEFFDFLNKEKDAWDAVRDVRGWIVEDASKEGHGRRAGGWSRSEVVTELGGVLKARDAKLAQGQSRPPGSHRLFSNMPFMVGGENRGLRVLGEGDVSVELDGDEEDESLLGGWIEKEDDKGWLQDDEIEEET
ncbi:Rad17 cell cycle checkpoint protein-domain-containing protein [Roridomyces roridus]|uniref:Rad17 cell cycle checkpoint protein-domain-containing protein n=1 Tax=Roridomyces roridus TaxID=1738132 RepID=A0AAD7CJR4_9AGAR|nr:Rad17 cell cycle checkpoint protein-domain-containing protein [Roridomyces roridus]